VGVKIMFNGKEYDSEDEALPPQVHEAYQRALNSLEDKNHNGMPDLLEQSGQVVKPRVVFKTRIKVNGKEYQSMEDVPADVRQQLGQLNLGRGADNASTASDSWPPPSQPIIPPVQDIPKTGDKRLALALGLIVVLVLVILGLLVVIGLK